MAADASHIFKATGLAAFLFVEPESGAGQALAASSIGGIALSALSGPALRPLLDRLAACFRANADDPEMIGLGREILAALAGSAAPIATDRRVRAMMAYAGDNLGNPLSLPLAASAACLSPSRARHLFVAETGLPFRTFVLWLRIKRAVEIFAAGASLTEAAHEAGFADSAHFSRTFRRNFGLPAAALRVNSRFVQAPPPEPA